MTTTSTRVEDADIASLLERVEKAQHDDWRLNEEIIAALGGRIRRVSRLGLTGRTRGSDRVFWPGDSTATGKRLPNFLKDEITRARALKRLRASLSQGAGHEQ